MLRRASWKSLRWLARPGGIIGLGLVLFCSHSSAAAPLQREGRRLLWEGNPIQLVGYSYYGLLGDRSFNANAFLETLAAHNINFTRFFLVLPWPVQPGPNVLPFAKVGDKYDLRQFDPEFFDRLRSIVQRAEALGIVCQVCLFDRCGLAMNDQRAWPNNPYNADCNVNGLLQGGRQGYPPFCQATGPIAEINAAFIRKVVETIGDCGNVIYELMNEPYRELGPLPQWHAWAARELRQHLNGRSGSKVIASTGPFEVAEIDLFSMHQAGDKHRVAEALRQSAALNKPVILSDDGDLRCMFNPDVTRASARRALELGGHFEHLEFTLTLQREQAQLPADHWDQLPGLCRLNLRTLAELSRPLSREASPPAPPRNPAGPWTVELGDRIIENGLFRMRPYTPDGALRRTERAGYTCYETEAARGGKYAYFRLEDSFPRGANPQAVTVSVEYHDEPAGANLLLQYDAESGPYVAARPVPLTGSGEWKTATFTVRDATFRGRQNDGADFRLSLEGGAQPLALRAVRVGRIGHQLAVSPGGHYLTYQGNTLLLIGDSGTQCVLQNINLDYRQWMDACATRGIRAVHVWSFMAPRQTNDGRVIEPRYGYIYPGVTPWARKTSGPNARDGLKQWDLTQFDDGPDGDHTHYWPRLRDLCAYARDRHIVVGITVFFGFPKHNRPERPLWSWHPFNVGNGGFLTDPKPIVTAPQTIYSPGKEVWREPWSEDWPPAMKTQWVWERFAAELIRQTQGFGNVFYVFMDEHSYPEGNGGDHFLEFFQKRGALWMEWGRRRDRVDLVYDQFLMRPHEDRRLLAQFGKAPIRPFFGLEEGGASGFNYTPDLLGMVWRYAIAGGHYFHHDDEGQETVTTGIMVFDPKVRGGRKDKVLQRLDWLGHASRFFNETVRGLDTMAPHNELVHAAGATYCLANPGVEYAVYSGAGNTFTLNLTAAAGKTVQVHFYDPRTGKWTASRTVSGGRLEKFQKPDGRPWAFYGRVE